MEKQKTLPEMCDRCGERPPRTVAHTSKYFGLCGECVKAERAVAKKWGRGSVAKKASKPAARKARKPRKPRKPRKTSRNSRPARIETGPVPRELLRWKSSGDFEGALVRKNGKLYRVELVEVPVIEL